MNLKHLTMLGLAIGLLVITPMTMAHAQTSKHAYWLGNVDVRTGYESSAFHFSKRYKNALSHYGHTYWHANAKHQTKLVQKTITKALRKQSYTFVAKPSDVHHYVNVYTLSHKDDMVINRFTFNIINKMRKQFHRPHVFVSPVMKSFTKQVMANYDRDKWNSFNGHDVPAVNMVAAKFGLPYSAGYQSYENSSVWTLLPESVLRHVSMATIKADIWYTLGTMMFEDDNEQQGHALSLSGAWYSPANRYSLGYIGFDHESAMHIEMANQRDLPKWMRR